MHGMGWDRPSKTALAGASAEREAAEVEAHNARQITLEIAQHVAEAQHSIELAYALLDDLLIYLPKVSED